MERQLPITQRQSAEGIVVSPVPGDGGGGGDGSSGSERLVRILDSIYLNAPQLYNYIKLWLG